MTQPKRWRPLTGLGMMVAAAFVPACGGDDPGGADALSDAEVERLVELAYP